MQEQKARAEGSGRELCINRSIMMEMSACKEDFIYVVPKRLMHTKEHAHSMGLEVVQHLLEEFFDYTILIDLCCICTSVIHPPQNIDLSGG